jgi:DNA-binding NarL/FixJ family response regulator
VLAAGVLPGINGLELLELLRIRGHRFPVILRSPEPRWPLRAHALDRGAAAVIEHTDAPMRLPEVLQALRAENPSRPGLASALAILRLRASDLQQPVALVKRLAAAATSRGHRQAVPLALGVAFGSLGVVVLSLLVSV